MSARFGTRVVLLVTIGTTVGCDHVTKQVAASTLAGTPARSFLADSVRLMYAENTGAFLSLGASLPPAVRMALFTIGTGVLLSALVAAAVRLRVTGWPGFGVALFLAGGTSNWLDRALHGSVIDFLNVGVGSVRTGIFNVADLAVVVGVTIVALTCQRTSVRADEC